MAMVRATVWLIVWWGAICSAAEGKVAAGDVRCRVELRGTTAVPAEAPGADGQPVALTGISGIAWLGDDRYVAVLDNSDLLVSFSLQLSRSGKPLAVRDAEALRVGSVFDFEDVAVCPEPFRRAFADRRIRKQGIDPGPCLLLAEEETPAIRAVSQRGGSLLGAVPLPDVLRKRRPNRGPESLAVDPDDGSLWTANEEALAIDGPASRADAGTTIRLVRVSPPADPPRPTRQYAYDVDPPHAFVRVFGGEPLAGVSALAALGGGRLLVLERAAGPGLPPFKSRLYLVDTTAADDVSAIDRNLATSPARRATKQLLWEDSLGCNLEGLCLGPQLPDGGQAVVAVADNGGLGTPNQLVVLAIERLPRPEGVPVRGAAVTAAALAIVMLLARLVGRVTSP